MKTVKKPDRAVILGFGVYFQEPRKIGTLSRYLDGGWLRTGSRVVHGIKTYPTLDEAMEAILTDPRFAVRVGRYQIVAEYAFFCRNGYDCPECLSHKPIESVDWSIVRSKAEVECI